MYFFDGENISFDAGLIMYINSINIPPIMIINSKYSVAAACFLPGRAKDLSAPLYKYQLGCKVFVGIFIFTARCKKVNLRSYSHCVHYSMSYIAHAMYGSLDYALSTLSLV